MTALYVAFFAIQPVQYWYAVKTRRALRAEQWDEFFRWWLAAGVLIVLQLVLVITILQRLDR